MSKKIIYLIVLALLVIGAVFAVKHKKNELANLQSSAKESVVAKVYEPKKAPIKLYLDALAVVASDKEINFSPRIGARVDFVAPLGSIIKKGEAVAKLDTNELKAEIESAKADLFAKEANYQNLKTVHERTVELLSVGGVSKEQSDNEESALLAAKSALQSAKSKLATLENSLSYMSLYAPFDGIVSQKFCNVGDYAPVGKSVVVFTGFDGKYLQTKLPQEVSAKDIVYNNKSYSLQKTNSSPDSLATYYARVENITQSVGAKLTCKVSVFDGNATFLPNDCVLKRADGNYVIALENGLAKPQKVNILSTGSDGYAINDVLDGKKLLLAKPDALLRALFGAKVETVK